MARSSKKHDQYPIIAPATNTFYTNTPVSDDAPFIPRQPPNRIPPIHLEELAYIWEIDKRIPTAASRRAWARARNLSPSKVNNWWYRKKMSAKKNGIMIPEEMYDLAVGIPPDHPGFLSGSNSASASLCSVQQGYDYIPYTYPQSLPPSSPPPEIPQIRKKSVTIHVKKEDPYQEAADHAALLSDDSKFGQTPGADNGSDYMHPSSDSSSDAPGSVANSDDHHYDNYHDYHHQFNGDQYSFSTRAGRLGLDVADDPSFYTTNGSFWKGNSYIEEKKYAYRLTQPIDSGNSAPPLLCSKPSDGDNKVFLRSPFPLTLPVVTPFTSVFYTAQQAAATPVASVPSLAFRNNEECNRVPSQLDHRYAEAQRDDSKPSTEILHANVPAYSEGNPQQPDYPCPLCAEPNTGIPQADTSDVENASDDSEPINSNPPLSLPVEQDSSDQYSTARSGRPSLFMVMQDPNSFSWCLGGRRFSYDGFFIGCCECSNTSGTAGAGRQDTKFEFKRYPGCTGPWEPFSAPEVD